MESIPDYLSSAVFWQYVAAAVIAALGLIAVCIVSIKLYTYRRLRKREMVWLEITPPSSIIRTPEATEQLFAVIHGTRAARQLRDKLLGTTLVASCEIVSTRKEGIRYLIYVDMDHASTIEKAVVAYIPNAKVKQVERTTKKPDLVREFRAMNHYVLPLTLTSAFAQHDPLSYVTSAMANLKSEEELTLQLVIKPVRLREANRLSHKILGNENILQQIGKGVSISKIGNALGTVTSGLTDMASEVYMGTTYGYRSYQNASSRQNQQDMAVTRRDRPSRTLSAFELEIMETMHQKVTRPLFQVNLRLLITSPDTKRHLVSLRSALDGYSVPPYQELKMKPRTPIASKLRARAATHRMPLFLRKQALILSVSELAGLYHFPASNISRTDNLITSLSRTLAAPVSLKSGRELSVLLGENYHHGVITPIGLTEAERERHVYVIGGTGNGKTTLLQYAIVQDIQSGKGVAVIDPHGDLAETLLRHIPEERMNDVIYMNPDDLAHPIGVNLLELPEGLEGDDLIREKDIVTESTISVLRKIFSEDDSGGHRIEYVLRNTIQTALTLEDPTLFTIFDLLNDTRFRRNVLRDLKNENLKNFWKNELGKAGDMQKVKMVAGITAKIGRFLFSGASKRVLEQKKSTINFDKILDEGKILICNFSKGLLGEDTSTLFGTTILAKLQLASLRRARIDAANRKPFYLYVDEFQNFATMSFVQMLSEARKYKLFLTMAEQSTSQQDQQRLVDIILANVGTVICFRSGSPADERLVLPLFSPYIEQGEIANLPAYSFYARVAAVQSQEPMSGMTVLLNSDGNGDLAKRIVESSQNRYARKDESAPKHTMPKKSTVPIKKPPTGKTTRALANAKPKA